MIIDIILKTTPAIAALGGLFVAIMTWKQKTQEISLRAVKLESEIIDRLSEDATKFDDSFRNYIENIKKDRLNEVLFGRPIPTARLGMVMEFYNKGESTLRDIKEAWPFHKIINGKITFTISPWQRAWMTFASIYAISCIVIVVCIFLVLFYSKVSQQEALKLSSQCGMLVVMAYLMLWANRGVFTARRLSKIK